MFEESFEEARTPKSPRGLTQSSPFTATLKWSNVLFSAINSTWLYHNGRENACQGPSVFDTVIWSSSSLSCHHKPRACSLSPCPCPCLRLSLSLSSPEGVNTSCGVWEPTSGAGEGASVLLTSVGLQSRSGVGLSKKHQVFLDNMQTKIQIHLACLRRIL